MISIKKTHNVFTFLLHLLSIAFVVMVGCDEPNKPTNGGGGTSLAAPIITTPPASQTVNEGSTAKFSVRVASEKIGITLSYQWQRAASTSKDFKDIARATDTIYTTPTLTKADDGTQYRVVVTATNESKETKSVTSSIAILTVLSSTSSLAAPSITKQPESQTISEGATANLSVEVTQISGVKFSYQWQKAAKDSKDFTDVKGANAGSYATPTLTAAENGTQYRVLVTATNESKETKSVLSSIATITVLSSTSSFAAPSITNQPTSQSIEEGNTADLSVKATHPSGATLFYQWQKAAKGSIDFDNIKDAVADSYTTPTLTAADNGTQYRVLVTAINESKETKSVTSDVAIITVTPMPAPTITKQPASQSISEGNTADLSVAATPPAGATLSYQWQKAAKGSMEFTNVTGATDTIYTTPTLTAADNGVQYRVVVTATKTTNITSTATSNIVTITVTPPVVSTRIEWTHTNGTKQYADVPSGGVLMWSVLTSNKDDIKSVNVIPSGVTSIGENAFAQCKNLTSINIPNTVTSMGGYVFDGCTALTSITLPSGIKSIGSGTFYNCTSLTSITIPSSVTSIGNNAFVKCTNLTNVRVEATTPPTAGTDMFKYTHASLIIRVPDEKVNDYRTATNWITYKPIIYGFNDVPNIIVWTHIDGTRQYTDARADDILLSTTLTNTKSDIKSVDIIPNSIKSIGFEAFYFCTELTSINIPNSVTSIEASAFSECKKLTSIDIPNGVTSIGNSAFFNCIALASINLPNSLKSIGENAFQQCTSLASITIPNNVTSIGQWAFSGTTSLTSITIPSGVNNIESAVFHGCLALANITIHNGIKSIGNDAFVGCKSLTSITIPSSVTSIGKSAFLYCTALASVRVEATTPPTAEADMFKDAHASLIIRVPDEKVGDYRAATNWTPYAPIIYGFNEVPNIIVWTHIDGTRKYTDAPANGSLDGTTLTPTATDIKSVDVIPNSITSIAVLAFSGSTSLESITLPNSITSIGSSAFHNCKALTSITIPNKVTSIAKNAFRYCIGLTSITIPNSVTSIGNNAFEDCKALARVKVEATQPPAAGTDMFSGTASNLSIQVPSGSVDAYKAAPNWSTYADKITGY